MGFGWLFVGYFAATLMTMNAFGSVIQLLGYGVMAMALMRLRQYHRAFGIACVGAAVMVALSLAFTAADLSSYLYEEMLLTERLLPEAFRTGLSYAEQLLSFVFQGLLLWAIRRIALETEVSKIAVNAVRNFVFLCIYEAVELVAWIPAAGVRACAKELTVMAFLLYFVCVILNLILFASCYARICDVNDVEMKQKPSRFAFVNRFREKMEQRELKAIEETRSYREEKKQKKKGARK